jgi:hypothetical protein
MESGKGLVEVRKVTFPQEFAREGSVQKEYGKSGYHPKD